MADFVKFAPKLKALEGGFVDDPVDRGGATMAGVTLSTYRMYYGDDMSVEDLKYIPNERWSFIMRKYWDRCKCDQIRNQSVAEMVCDWHVNAGINAIKAIQKMLLITADGIIGSQTLKYLNSPAESVIFNRLKQARIDYYRKIVQRNPSQNKFLRGWLNRVNSFEFEP